MACSKRIMLVSLLASLLFGSLTGVTAQTPTHHVALTGNDTTGTGSAALPWRTIGKALSTCVPGNVVLVHAGTYYERVTPTVSGLAGSPITVLGELGAGGQRLTILDGSDAMTGWVTHPSTYGGLWKTTSVPYEVGWLGVDDGTTTRHILPMLTGSNYSTPNFTEMDYPASYLVAKSYITGGSARILYWDGFEALWTGGTPTVYVRFRNGDDPNAKQMRVAPRYQAALKLHGVHHLTVKNFRIRGAYYAIWLTTTAADIVIENNELTNGHATIAAYGPHRVVIRNNFLHQDRVPIAYPLGPMLLSGADGSSDPVAGTYQYAAVISSQMNWWFKNYGVGEGVGIDTLYDPAATAPGLYDSDISGNTITDYPALGIALVNSANVRIFGNDISHTSDAGIVMGFTLTNIQIYDNYFHDDSINLRPGIEVQPQEIYVYRNRFDQPIRPGGRILWICCRPPGEAHAEASYDYKHYYYHNSFLGHLTEALGNGDNDFRDNLYFLNNVWSVTQIFPWDTGGFNPGIALFDYEWAGGALGTTYVDPPRVNGLRIGAHTILAPGQQQWTAKAWNVATQTNFTLPAASAARNAGIDVTTVAATALVGRPSNQPLPGFSVGYFTGSAPHMGAVQDITTPPDPGQETHLAFPTAEGFGRFAKGGRGGKAYNINVTTAGAGTGGSCNAGGCSGGTITFQDCLLDRFAVGPRTCIFKTGGRIDWPCTTGGCVVTAPYLTIAGQTAPGDGIMVSSAQLTLQDTHNVIVRHLRVRPGKATPTAAALRITGTTSHDLIFDHVSSGWTPVDAVSGEGASNVTRQWGLLSEALGTSGSTPAGCGVWSPGAAPGSKGLSVLYSLIANQWHHCLAHGSGAIQWTNNVFYNVVEGGYLAAGTTVPIQASYVNNVFKVGPQSNSGSFPNYPRVSVLGCSFDPGGINCATTAASSLYVSGNIHSTLRPSAASGSDEAVLLDYGTPILPRTTTPPDFPTLSTVVPASQVVTDIVPRVGAYAVADGVYATIRRDTIDARAVSDVNAGTGNAAVLDEATVGGYPSYAAGTGYPDTDSDGMADAWETAHGLNPADPADGPALVVGGPNAGYSNLEVFLNELAGDGFVPPAPAVPAQVLRVLVK